MGHGDTNPAHIDLMMTQCAAHGFEPFHVRSPSMGYLYNRYKHILTNTVEDDVC